MEKLRYKLAHFIYGRYGVDQLYYALLVPFFIMAIVNNFVRWPIMDILIWAVLIWITFRTFSKNIYKRRMENEKFMKFFRPIKSAFSLAGRRIKEVKTHRYRKCPNCKKVLRLRRKTGKHTVECPCCHKDFAIRVLF